MGYTCQSPSMFSTNAPTNVGTGINCLSHVSTLSLSLHSVGSRSCTNHTSSVVVTRPHLCQLLSSRILISNRLKVIQAFSQGGGLRMYRTHWHCLVGGNTGYMIWVAARAPGLHVVCIFAGSLDNRYSVALFHSECLLSVLFCLRTPADAPVTLL